MIRACQKETPPHGGVLLAECPPARETFQAKRCHNPGSTETQSAARTPAQSETLGSTITLCSSVTAAEGTPGEAGAIRSRGPLDQGRARAIHPCGQQSPIRASHAPYRAHARAWVADSRSGRNQG